MRTEVVSREEWRRARLDIAAANDLSTSPGSTGSALGAAGFLSLAAAPTFAIMALLTGVPGGGPSDMLCAAAQDASPLSGMAAMYMLMSAFHSAPWLKLIAGRRSGAESRHTCHSRRSTPRR